MKTFIFACLFCLALPATAAGGLATVETRTLASPLSAYAHVEAIRTLTLHAMVAGTIMGLRVVPGMAVHKGQVLAKLAGPEYTAALQRARSNQIRAQTAFKLAQKTVRGVARTYPDLSTRQQLDQAHAAVADARAHLQAARARLDYLRAGHRVRAPTGASVLALFVDNGERVATGDPLMRMLARRALWLRAVFYGKDIGRLHPGMRGVFQPAAGGKPIPVRVRSVIDPLRPDGGRGIACVPAKDAPTWYSGEAGTLHLDGLERTWTAVPTRALILDSGRWWVLIHTTRGARRHVVEPGPTVGPVTLIAKGLKAGQQVIVTDAYLRFHREFAHRYQPPD